MLGFSRKNFSLISHFKFSSQMDQAQRSDAFNSHERDIHSRSAFSKRPQPPHQRLVAEGIFFCCCYKLFRKTEFSCLFDLKLQ